MPLAAKQTTQKLWGGVLQAHGKRLEDLEERERDAKTTADDATDRARQLTKIIEESSDPAIDGIMDDTGVIERLEDLRRKLTD